MKTSARNPKSEIRSPKSRLAGRNPLSEINPGPFARASDFGFRPARRDFGLRISVFGFLVCLLTSALCPQAFAQGTAFTYQAQLDQLGGPANGNFDLSFSVFTGPVGPGQVGNTLTNANVALSNGLVTVTLDFGAGIFTGADRWLEIAMRTNGTGPFTTLVPRQQLTPTPYAITAANLSGTLPAAGLSGIYSNALTFSNATNSFTGNGAALTGLNATNVATGVLADARLSSNVAFLAFTQTFVGVKTFTSPANSFTGNGAGLSALNASNLSSGTVPDARLSAQVALLNTNQTFTADKTFGSGAQLFADTGTFTAPGLSFSGDPNTGIFSPLGNTVSFTTAGFERMRINSSGDVGIGATNIEARLH